MKSTTLVLIILFSVLAVHGQHLPADSLATPLPLKLVHAEPLYIDLIRDLGARKGEREWNVGMGVTDKLRYDEQEYLIEYEWAVRDRLGLEVELPFTFHQPLVDTPSDSLPLNRLNSLKLATQWTFLVQERYRTSAALGYIHEFELTPFGAARYGVRANVFNPFLIVAKNWGQNWHTLLYTGPRIEHDFVNDMLYASMQYNTSIHYMIPGTRNFVGLEINTEQFSNDWDVRFRPQMRVALNEQLMLGIVVAMPVTRERERLGAFVRIIWEPKHH